MNEGQLERELCNLIAEITEIEPEKVTLNANLVEDLDVDSMMAVEILAAIEKKYKLQIPEDSLTKIISLQSTIDLVNSYLNKKR